MEKLFPDIMENMSNEHLRQPKLKHYVLLCQKKTNKQSLVTSHKAILLHITELQFCHINGSLMGHPHLKDRCVLICVILRNTTGSGNYLSGQQILQNE